MILFFALLVFLFPVAIYLLFLAYLNYRQSPALVPGVWDFAGLLFATSGFILLGGPLILSGFHGGFQELLAGDWRHLFGSDTPWWPFWQGLWLLYIVGVVGGSAWLFLRRRRVAVVYNVDPAVLDAVLAQVLDRLGLHWNRQVNRIRIGYPSPAGKQEAIQAVPPAENPPVATRGLSADLGPTVLDLDPFPAMRNVTLRWRSGSDDLRRQVEGALAHALADVTTDDNPSAGWFLSAAALLFSTILFGMILILLVVTFSRL